jgi:hypothetical protein
MRTLIVPDIHERLDQLLRIEERYFDRAERVIFLGDFFDTFNDHHYIGIARWLVKNSSNPRYTFLWGNHDCHYAFNHDWFKCSGYTRETQEALDQIINREVWDRFKLWTRCGKFIVSHAGFSAKTLKYRHPELAEEALRQAWESDEALMKNPFWMPGACVGGPIGATGGPTWLRWQEEFRDIPENAQIVGHTYSKEGPQWKGSSLNLDTDLRYGAWVNETNSDVEIINFGANSALPKGA